MALAAEDLTQVNDLVAAGVKAALAPLDERFKGLATTSSIEEIVKKLIPAPPVVTPPPDDKKPIEGESVQMTALRKELEKVTNAQKASEEKTAAAEKRTAETEKKSAIQTAMQGFDFHDENAREDCYAALDKIVARNDQGELLAEGLAVDTFVKDFIPTKKSYLLKPVATGGSGAASGNGRAKASTFGIENIKVGMSDADTKSAVSAIVAALPGAGFTK